MNTQLPSGVGYHDGIFGIIRMVMVGPGSMPKISGSGGGWLDLRYSVAGNCNMCWEGYTGTMHENMGFICNRLWVN